MNYGIRRRLFILLLGFPGISKFNENRIFKASFWNFDHLLTFPGVMWGSHIKCVPNRFTSFDVGCKQTERHADKKSIFECIFEKKSEQEVPLYRFRRQMIWTKNLKFDIILSATVLKILNFFLKILYFSKLKPLIKKT